MADNTAATLSILIDIKSRLDELSKTQEALRRTKEEASGISEFFREGIGIGSGIELARRAADLFKETIVETAHRAFELAAQVRDGSEALGVSGEAYQVYAYELGKANVDMGRFSMAVASQTQSLAALRSGLAGASGAYRTLNLDAAQLEAMTPDQRVLAVARATLNATDRTKAFDAAGQILGSRGLPQLLAGLKTLAADGYDKVAESARKAGLIMDDQTAARIDRAEKALSRARLQATIQAGEGIGGLDALRESFAANWKETLASLFSGIGQLAETVGKYAKPVAAEEPAVPTDPSAVAREVQLRSDLRKASLDLLEAQQASDTAANNGTLTDTERSRAKLAALNAEVIAREKILEITRALGEFDQSKDPTAFQASLIKATSDLAQAKNQLAVADGGGASFETDRLQTLINQLNGRAQFWTALNPLRTEADTRKMMLPILDRQIAAYERMADLLYPDAADLATKQKLGTITPAELQRLNDYLALQEKLYGAVGARNQALLPVAADKQIADARDARQTAAGMTARERSIDDAVNINNPRENPNYQTAGQGMMSGFAGYVNSLGSTGEQVANTLQSTVGSEISNLSDGIVGLITHTKTWGDIGRSAGLMFLQALVQLGIQMLAQKALTAGVAAFHTAMEGEKTAATIAGEATRTGATATGTAARSGLHIAETIVHGVQVAIRVAAHLAGEVLQTGITIVQSGLRIASIVAESLVYLVKAAIGAMSAMASIPYVGPILAIAAMAAIIAAGSKLIHRETGGPVKRGQSYIVGEKRPEVFVPDEDGTIIPSVGQYQDSLRGDAADSYRLPAQRNDRAAAMASGANVAQAASSRPTRYVHVMAPDMISARRLMQDPEYDNLQIDWARRNKGAFAG